MQMRVSFHFHAYQPGDVILRRPGSPQSPPEYLERRSPVSLMMGDQRIRGENWTGAMLNFYGAIWKLFGEMGSGSREPAAGSRDQNRSSSPGCPFPAACCPVSPIAQKA